MDLDCYIFVKTVFRRWDITDLQICLRHFMLYYYQQYGHPVLPKLRKWINTHQPLFHSEMHTAMRTVSKQLETILKEVGAVVATLVPEQYKPTAVEAKSHSMLGRPLYITRNANGDFIWTGKSLIQISDTKLTHQHEQKSGGLSVCIFIHRVLILQGGASLLLAKFWNYTGPLFLHAWISNGQNDQNGSIKINEIWSTSRVG